MHDIRRPYNRSSSNPHRDLNSRVEQFETRSYERDGYDDREEVYDDGPVQIPVKRVRRSLDGMEMYPRRKQERDEYESYQNEEGYTDNRRAENSGRRFEDKQVRRIRKERDLGTYAFITTVFLLVAGAGLLTFVFNSATITIVPKYKDILDLNKTIVFSSEKQDLKEDVVPYIVATTSITKSKTLSLSESRKVESKAEGKVTLYNNYDSNPQKLIKNTRLESASGKIYRINQSVVVPGKKGDTPGSLEVTVFADSNGTSYNTGPTDFTIPGFKGTPREKAFYGKSKTVISGGSSGNVSSASLSDMNAAKDSLAIELAQEIKSSLFKIQKDGYIGLYSAAEIVYSDNENEILSGASSNYEVTAIGYVIFADASVLAKTIARDLRDYSDEAVRLTHTDTITYTRKDTDRISKGGTLSVLVEGKPRVVWVSDLEAIKDAVKGKKRDDFKPVMKSLTTVEGAEINFSPIWLSSFPGEVKKISVIESLPKR